MGRNPPGVSSFKHSSKLSNLITAGILLYHEEKGTLGDEYKNYQTSLMYVSKELITALISL